MPLEIEAKFLNVDINDIRSKLQAAGGKLEHPMRIMRREHFDYPDERYQHASGGTNERLRIRDEGDKVTATYKRSSPDSTYDVDITITVDSYESTKQLLTAIGLQSFNYQETKRETWMLDDTEVVIDEWPWAAPYVEIEGKSEEDVKAVAAKLGFEWTSAQYGSADTVYAAQYPKWATGDSIGFVPVVKFNTPLPDYLKERMR